MPYTRPTKLDPPVDPARDHLLGDENAELALVEYGNYTRDSCHAAHEVVADLRDRFGSRMRYVFRHRPAGENNNAVRAAELAEFASAITGQFWPVHDALMKRGPVDQRQRSRGNRPRIQSPVARWRTRRRIRGGEETRAGGPAERKAQRRDRHPNLLHR